MSAPLHGFEPGREPERYEFQGWGVDLLGGPIDRRAFLRRLGGGLVVLCLAGRSRLRAGAVDGEGAGEDWPDRGGRPAAQVAAWLHVAPDGAVTAYSGKVEIGQNARTSLTQAVAEELHVAPETIRVVMGDTAQVPYDRGTFGSLTTPTVFLALRRAAAVARGALIDLAAESLAVDRAGLVAAAGRVEHRGSGRSLGYGELTRGRELLETIDEATTLIDPTDWQVAGTSLPKVDARAMVTGRHRFASDLKRPGMGHGKVLRPPAVGATLAALDASAAEALPGVVVVRDGEFVGVVADDEPTAAAALKALRAEWSPSPLKGSDADLADHLLARAESPRRDAGQEDGSVAEGLAAVDVTVGQTYTCAYIAHVPLEPRACVAEWQGDRLTAWVGTQVPFGVRAGVAQAFGLPQEQVRVIVPDTGSGYGGKHSPEVAIEAARLARAAGRPVKLVWTREEEFAWGYLRPAGVVEATAGARSDGTLTAWSFRNINSGAAGLGTPYEVPNRLVAFLPSDSPLRQGSYRALASTFNHFARESLMDELARELKMDPLAFRLKNLSEERIIAVLRAATERFGWGDTKAGPDRGVGLACGLDKGGAVATCAEVAVDRDRGDVAVLRIVTAFEAGAIVNPDHLTNQVEGATMMGLGGALFERIRFVDGVLRNGRLSRYRVPRFSDTPPIDVVLIDRKDRPPAGAGEIPIVAVAPAIANAICDATGTRLRSMPLVPEGLKG